MDPLTHGALGAAAAGLIGGQRNDLRIPLCGAMAGALPDIDIIPTLFMDPMASISWHRGFTHSLVFVLLVSVLLGYWFFRVFKNDTHDRYGPLFWSMALAAALCSHIALDCFTTYGTRIFLPFSDYRVAFSTIAIIDPAYSIPVVISALSLFAVRNSGRVKKILFYGGLCAGTIYLMFTVINKMHIDEVFTRNLHRQHRASARLMTTPMPFSNFLWVGIAEGHDSYYTGYYSLLDRDDVVIFTADKKNHEYISGMMDDQSIQTIISFAKEFYSIEFHDGDIVFNDLRYGSYAAGIGKKEYVFSYIIRNTGGSVVIAPKGHRRFTADGLKLLFRRIAGRRNNL